MNPTEKHKRNTYPLHFNTWKARRTDILPFNKKNYDWHNSTIFDWTTWQEDNSIKSWLSLIPQSPDAGELCSMCLGLPLLSEWAAWHLHWAVRTTGLYHSQNNEPLSDILNKKSCPGQHGKIHHNLNALNKSFLWSQKHEQLLRFPTRLLVAWSASVIAQ